MEKLVKKKLCETIKILYENNFCDFRKRKSKNGGTKKYEYITRNEI